MELGYGRYFAVRRCGSSWAYCDGNCGICTSSKIETSDHTEPVRLDYYYSTDTGHGGVYIFGKQKQCPDDYGVADANRIAEARERTEKLFSVLLFNLLQLW